MKSFVPVYQFNKGLQTRRGEDFTEPDEFRIFQNVRWDCSRRPGQDRIAVATNLSDSHALEFNGSSKFVQARTNANVWTMPLQFSLRTVIKQANTPSGDEFILGWEAGTGPITLKLNSSSNVVFSITDSAAVSTSITSSTSLTPGTAYSILITRDKSALKMYIDNALVATGTMSATLLGQTPTQRWMLFAANGAPGLVGTTVGWFDGVIDHVILYNIVLADNAEGFIRACDPSTDEIMAYYPFDFTASNQYIYDYSRFENTAQASSGANAPNVVDTLCVRELPVRGIFQIENANNSFVAVVCGRQYFNVRV